MQSESTRLTYVYIVWKHPNHNGISIKYTTPIIRIVIVYKPTVFIHIGAYCIHTFSLSIYMHIVYIYSFLIYVCMCVYKFFFILPPPHTASQSSQVECVHMKRGSGTLEL